MAHCANLVEYRRDIQGYGGIYRDKVQYSGYGIKAVSRDGEAVSRDGEVVSRSGGTVSGVGEVVTGRCI